MMENGNWSNKDKDKLHTYINPQLWTFFSTHKKTTAYNHYKINNLTTYLTRNIQQNIVQQLLQGSTELDKHISIQYVLPIWLSPTKGALLQLSGRVLFIFFTHFVPLCKKCESISHSQRKKCTKRNST